MIEHSIKKLLLHFIILISTLPCFAQPTGHQKIFFEITDQGDTINFKNCFKSKHQNHKKILKYHKFQLIDNSINASGFMCHPFDTYIYKTLMNDDHRILIVKNDIDTMKVEILNAFNVYFISIPFQKGHFKLIINDAKLHQWNYNTLPYKRVSTDRFVYDISPKNWQVFKVNLTKTNEDYFISLHFEKQNLLTNAVLPEDDPNFKNPRRISTLKLEVGDFNFDAKQDYREKQYKDHSKWNYFIYKDSNTGFVLDSLMSQLNIIKFDYEKKTFEVAKSGNKTQTETYEFAQGKARLVNKRPINIDSTINSKKDEDIKLTSSKIYTAQPFKFILEKNTAGINLPNIKGSYANKVTVFDIKSNLSIYEIVAVGNALKESPICPDSLQIADYNFDGFPDFRICFNNGADKHTYYIYHPKRNTFIIEKTLSDLKELSFDFEQKIVKGQSERLSFMTYPSQSKFQYYYEHLTFEGPALENLIVRTSIHGVSNPITEKCKYIKQKRIFENDTLGQKLHKKNLLIKVAASFKFQMEFNPEDYKTSGEKGAYVKVLKIFQGQKLVGQFEIHGNYLKELAHYLDSLEIADYNFDHYPDIRIYNSIKANGTYIYMLYNSDKDKQHFYEDGLFSAACETEYIPNRYILKGKIIEPQLTRYFFLKKDTLTISIQDHDLSKEPFIEESIYKNGNRMGIRSAYGSLEPALKKEYGDYNFDGYEDFRQERKKWPYQWDVFIYNPKKESFVKDTLMSKFEYFDYNKLNKTLVAYYTNKTDPTTRITYYYQWRFAKQKMELYQEKVCFYKFPNSESNRCIVSQLVNGKWIEIEQFGAE